MCYGERAQWLTPSQICFGEHEKYQPCELQYSQFQIDAAVEAMVRCGALTPSRKLRAREETILGLNSCRRHAKHCTRTLANSSWCVHRSRRLL
jgi:hypothetical protein